MEGRPTRPAVRMVEATYGSLSGAPLWDKGLGLVDIPVMALILILISAMTCTSAGRASNTQISDLTTQVETRERNKGGQA